jgi:hypothetical protein
MAAYLCNAKFQEMSSSPLKALGELAAVLEDEDGDLKVDMIEKDAPLRPDQPDFADRLAPHDFDYPDRDDEDESAASSKSAAPAKKERTTEEIFALALQDHRYELSEQVVEAGAEVTAFGTYQSKSRAINVGGAFKNVSHSLERGAWPQVRRRMIVGAIAGSIFWSAVWIGGHVAAFKPLRAELVARWQEIVG